MSSLRVVLPDLLRTFSIQDVPRLMLFLGAGASAHASIPTAADMIWMFKREIYCSDTGISKEAFRDLSVERNRRRLQEYFDSKGDFPPQEADSEYSFYFERCYPVSEDRRSFIRQLLQQCKPTIGHECLAALLAQGHCDWVWTTNFDDLVERAERSDTPRRLYHVGPESRERLDTILAERCVPVLVKLHGDYRYDKLQNTDGELQFLDEKLRASLVQVSKDNGLIVIGYSGRDQSVMSALEASVAAGGLRGGLYWCVREGEQTRRQVETLVRRVVQKAGRGGFVEVTSFDDLLFRLYRQCDLKDAQIDTKAEALFEQRRPFIFVTETKPRNTIKVNAIKVMEYPTTPYRFLTSIKNWQELRDIVDHRPIAAGLLHGHVLAFGNRERIRSVFGDKITGPIELSDIRPGDLIRSDSVTIGLLYDMIGQSLADKYGLFRLGRRTFYVVDPAISSRAREFRFQHQGKQFSIPMAVDRDWCGQRVIVNEAFSYQLGFHEGTLWLILRPEVVVTSDGQVLAPVEQRRAIANPILSQRYNMGAHERLLFWFYYLSSITNPISFVFPSRYDPSVQIVLDTHYAFSSQREVSGKWTP
ncbi:MAG TPA: SIR2 family protein [Desulfatiglandales bacterium]|nr:SIR2 family protein [Desulfatiglandales bacterium]